MGWEPGFIGAFTARSGGGSRMADLDISVAACLSAQVEAGFALHDCASRSPLGGVCVTPSTISPHEPDAALIVTWSVSERLQEGPRYDVYQAVLATMNAALADVVEALGFVSEPFGRAGASLVSGGCSDVERPVEGVG